jgi:tyrosyl-tRNA synthetase
VSARAIDHDLLSRICTEVVTLDELKEKIKSGRQLRVKFGVDCTAPFLHLGHAVNLWLMRHFQECGHVVDLLLGTATTRIGDPTGRSDARPVLSDEEVQRNAEAFIDQAKLVLLTDSRHLCIRRNGEWFDRMPTPEFLRLASYYSVNRLSSRESFRSRQEMGHEVRVHELLYPVLQAYDSVVLESDLAPVGSDQLFNEMLGRDLQQKLGKERQVVMTTRITMGLDGRAKQSKSLNNYVALVDSPRDKFGKVMSLPDEHIIDWLEVYTTMPLAEIGAIRTALAAGEYTPRDAKLMLARKIVERYHGAEQGSLEERHFIKVFSKGEQPEDVAELRVSRGANLVEILEVIQPGTSRSQLRRLVTQGAVELDGKKLADPLAVIAADGAVLRVGRQVWRRLRFGE